MHLDSRAKPENDGRKRLMKYLALAALCTFGSTAAAAPAPAPRDDRVWAAAEARRPEQMKLLEQLVNIDSGTGDVEGGRKIAAVLTPRLKALGMTVETVAAEAPGL